MGNSKSGKDSKYYPNVVMNGLDAAGKTTIVYKLRDPNSKKYPELWEYDFWGQRCDHLYYKSLNIFAWDVGGQQKIKPLWRAYYECCKALIWVIDVNDVERLNYDPIHFDDKGNVHDELHWTLNRNDMSDVILCILLNKQDLVKSDNINPSSLTMDMIQERIGMFQYNGIDAVFLQSIIKDLPNEVINIIAQYTPNKETGPCEAWRICVDDLFMNISRELLSNNDIESNGKILICRIICSYLPPYKYIKGRQTQCKIFKTCGISGDGVREAMDWVNNVLYKSKTTKDCIVM